MSKLVSIAAALAATLFSSVASASLILNGSFEAPAGYHVGSQGIMPPNWAVTNITPDLYSSDGSFGLSPTAFGNFTGVTAQDGLGWVAGWTSVTESFAQQLQTALTPNTAYRLDGYLLQAKRSDLDNPGAYDILLNNANSLMGAVFVARLNPTTNSDNWESFSKTFIAPSGADQLPWLIFRPYKSGTGEAYAGLDNISLELANVRGEVPEPSSVCLALSGALGIGFVRRRRRST